MSAKQIIDAVNTEDFITQIELYPVLWNVQSDGYSNRIVKKNAWEQVLTHFIPGFYEKDNKEKKELGSFIQTKWKSLRNSYARELAKKRKEKSGSAAIGRKQYVYFEQLRFLETCSKETSGSLTETSNDQPKPTFEGNIEDRKQVKGIHPMHPKPQQKRHKYNNKEEDELIAVLKNEVKVDSINGNNSSEDEDKLFLLSLLPELKQIPKHIRLRTKSQLIDVLLKAQESSIPSCASNYYCRGPQHHGFVDQTSRNPYSLPIHMSQQSPFQDPPRYKTSMSHELTEQPIIVNTTSPVQNISSGPNVQKANGLP